MPEPQTTPTGDTGDNPQVTTPADNPTPSTTPGEKMVPERDLIAVKRGAEKAVADAEATIKSLRADMENTKATSHAEKLNLEAQIEQLKSNTPNAADIAKVGELQSALDDINAKIVEKDAKILEFKRNELVTIYKLDEDKIKEKTEEQLDSLKEALMLTGGARTPSGTGFDKGSGGEGAAPTGRALEYAEVAAAKGNAGKAT